MDKAYLGDGVYVEHDGYALTLTTERAMGTHMIHLEPELIEALIKYWKKVTKQNDDTTRTV